MKKKGWRGQSPPVQSMQYLKKFKNNFGLWKEGEKPQSVNIAEVPTLADIRGSKVHHIH